MGFKKINIYDLKFNPFDLIGNKWYLITSGTPDHYNTMTASWGQMGIMWGVPATFCAVRTSRHTFDYMERNNIYTFSFFDDKYHKVLGYCGSHSGRDVDKAKETGITPVEIDGSTTFKEAKLVFVIKKMYSKIFDPGSFTDPEERDKHYNENNPLHKEYIGEILAVYVKE